MGAARSRVAWIDALKGIGILAVVVGHIWAVEPLHRLIYIWHMPLFFLLAGYSHRRQDDGAFMVRQMRTLALPWLAWSALLFGLDHLIEGMRGVRPIYPDVMAALNALFLDAAKLRGPFAILWFPPCLLVARALHNLLLRRIMPAKLAPPLVMAALIFAAGHGVTAQGWPAVLGLASLLPALGFILIGGIWKVRPPVPLSMPVLAMIAIGALAVVPPVNLKDGAMGWPVATAAGAIAITLCLAKLLALWAPPGLAAIGRMSMTIMFAHLAFVHYLAPYAERWQLAIAAIMGSMVLHWLIGLWGPISLLLRGEPLSAK